MRRSNEDESKDKVPRFQDSGNSGPVFNRHEDDERIAFRPRSASLSSSLSEENDNGKKKEEKATKSDRVRFADD